MIKLIQTTVNGIPDTILIKDGKVIFAEIKRPNKVLDPLQEYRKKQLIEHGIEVLTLFE